jgi:hypothetical protein
MAQVICDSFKVELFQAIHDFTTGSGDTFKMALYTSSANLGQSTTAYSTTNEIIGAGYVPGGVFLTSVSPTLIGSTAVIDFDDVTYGPVTITYRQMLLYNSTKSNRAVAVFTFDSDRVISGGNLIIQMPPASATNAILRAS